MNKTANIWHTRRSVIRPSMTRVVGLGLALLSLEGCADKQDEAGSGGGSSNADGGTSTGSQASTGGTASGGSRATGGAGANSSGGSSADTGGSENAGGSSGSGGEDSGSGGEDSGSGGGPPVSCTDDFDCEGFSCCDNKCVNPANDPMNCGQCGVACEDPTPYCSGSCTARPCSATCDGGETCCGSTCCDSGEICCMNTVGPSAPRCTVPENGTCPLGCPDCD